VAYESDDEQRGEDKSGLYLEDLLIFLAVGALFVLGVLFRDRSWSKPGLIGVLVVMVLVFISRFRRVHRAFKGQDEDV
jgi:hypothetical protein